MFYEGQFLILRLDPEGVSLTEGVRVPARSVQLGQSDWPYAPHSDLFWIEARVVRVSGGVLECQTSGRHPGAVKSFFSQNAHPGEVSKLVLIGDEVLPRLTGGAQAVPPTVDHSAAPRQKTFTPESLPPVRPFDFSVNPLPRPEEHPVREYQMTYTYRFREMQIVDGAALFQADFKLPEFCRLPVRLELRVKNEYLRHEFDSIKDYISNCLKTKTIEVAAVIRCQGSEVLSSEAESPQVALITPDLLAEVKTGYIRRELREAEDKAGLVTVNDLFEKVKGSGLLPDDRQFIQDLLKVKQPKHAEHMQYLSGLHLYDLMRLRMQKKPFAFVCLVSGKAGCFFVLETLDKTDATYLWKLPETEMEPRQTGQLIRKAFLPVEQDISLIRDQGRNPYRSNPPANFFFVRHDYTSSDGFMAWKIGLHQVIDGEDQFKTGA